MTLHLPLPVLFATLLFSSLASAQSPEWRYFTPKQSVLEAFSGTEPKNFRFCATEAWQPATFEHAVVSSIGSVGRYINLDDGIEKTRGGACEVLAVPWHLVQDGERTLSNISQQGFLEIPFRE